MNLLRRLLALPIARFAAAILPLSLCAATATLQPSKDTSIWGNGDVNLSNGGGTFLFAGSAGPGGGARKLRSLIAFNLSSIPAGSTINSVTLTLTITTPLASNAATVQLHRLQADWGEGTARATGAGGGEGNGATAAPGDATWNARFLGTSNWTTPGGDFVAALSGSRLVTGSSGTARFEGAAGMVADVQAWVNNPASNFGWIMIASDETDPAVRFSSRQGATPPSLVIDYTPGSGGGGNTAPTFTTQPASQTVTAGGNATFTAATSGTPTPTYQWRRDGNPINNATASTLTLTNVSTADAGTYTVVATNVAGTATSQPATLTVTPANSGGGGSGPVTARLSNLSVRASMAAGQTLFVGFSVSGGSRSILMRGVGPTLGGFGLAGTMADPRIELYNGTALVTENEDWGNNAAITTAANSVGAFPLLAGSRDAALLQSVDGTRSVQLKGTGAGVALVELYDTGAGNTPRLVNVSARNQVGTGDNILIFGFFIDGNGTKNVLIRAIGPRLADLGVSGVLADPRLDLFRAGSTTAVSTNDNWAASLAATFTAVGAFDLVAGSRDAALVTALTPGAYTVQVSGVNNTTGEALVEIYEVP